MNCAEFQKVLPYIIETGGNAEEEQHLRECPVCSDLVQDLRYIAEQAKLLVPMEEPSPQVWDGIKGALEREGLIRPARARGRLLGSKSNLPWLGALGAVVLVIFALFLVQRGREQASGKAATQATSTPVMQAVTLESVATERDDQNLLQLMANARPHAAQMYEASLKLVNASIADAKQWLKENPDDTDARRFLRQAYQQKAMLYEMAAHALR